MNDGGDDLPVIVPPSLLLLKTSATEGINLLKYVPVDGECLGMPTDKKVRSLCDYVIALFSFATAIQRLPQKATFSSQPRRFIE